MKEADIKKIIHDEMKNFINNNLDNEIKKLLKTKNSSSREELIDIIRDGIEAVYKVLWQKKEFWRSQIK